MPPTPETESAEMRALQTRAAVLRFLVMTAATLLFSSMAEAETRLAVLHAMLLVTAGVAVAFALVKREPIAAPALNRWDEALAHLALALLVGLFLGDASVRPSR